MKTTDRLEEVSGVLTEIVVEYKWMRMNEITSNWDAWPEIRRLELSEMLFCWNQPLQSLWHPLFSRRGTWRFPFDWLWIKRISEVFSCPNLSVRTYQPLVSASPCRTSAWSRSKGLCTQNRKVRRQFQISEKSSAFRSRRSGFRRQNYRLLCLRIMRICCQFF